MKRKNVFTLIELLFSLFSLTSCVRIAGNHIHYYKVDNIEDFTYQNLKIDISNKTYDILVRAQDTMEFSSYIVDGGTAPRYGFDIEEGYESIEDNILSLNTLDDRSVIYTSAYLKGNYVFGFCNFYYQTIGYLSGGGNYGEEEIAYSIFYKYDNASDTLESILRLENATMLAFNDDYIVYWKKKAFYSYNLTTGSFVKLCDHLSYDSGFTHQSITSIYFDDNYVIIEMKKAKSFNRDYYYIYLYEYGKEISKLNHV